MHFVYTCGTRAVNATNWQSLTNVDRASGFLISDFLPSALSFNFSFTDPMFPFVLHMYFFILPQNSNTYGSTAVPAGNRLRSSNQPPVTLQKRHDPHTSRDVIVLH